MFIKIRRMTEKEVFEYPLGRFFGPTKRGLSLFCAVIVIFSFITGTYVVSFFFFILIFILLFSRKGMTIDVKKREYKLYLYMFSFRTYGKPKPIDEFASVSILKSNLVHSAYSRSNRSAVTGIEKTYNLVLLCNRHIMKLVLGKFTDKEEALNQAKKLSELLNMPFELYNPQIGRHAKTFGSQRK